MPSTTRGSILISTANDIGEALVEKLGGVGYSPNEWKEKYNLCGIAPVDSAPALSVLADSAGTGDERGSILIATADAIGAILNKKYNVLRGFKPKEWASACRKMKALEEGSVASSSIASFDDGADDVQTKSLVVTIPPTLSGVSSVNAENDGNLCDFDNYNVEANTNTTVALGADLTLKKGTYTLAFNISDTVTATRNRPCYVVNGNYTYADSDYKTSGRYSWTFTLADDATLSIRWWAHTVSANITISNFMLTQGSTAHAYKPYQTPTTYTASLGRTIYGGQVDIVNGTGTDENGNDFTFTGQEINTRLGYNAFWSDSGNTAVEYYQAPTPYARKTATGGIANFSDQRTDLPLTKAIANIAPSIAGKSAVNLARAGQNLLLPHNADIAETTLNGIKRSYSLDNQEFTFVGTNTKTDASWLIYSLNAGDFVLNGLKPGATYIFSHNLTAYMYAQVTYNKTGGGIGAMGYLRGNAGQNASVSFTLPSDFDSLRGFQIGVVDTATSVNVTAHFQIEVGSAASSFVPYQAPTTYTAELGETVYGGSVDFVSGAKSVEYGYIVFDGSEDENWSDYPSYEGYSINIPTMMSGTRQDGACNLLTRSTTSAQGQTNVFWLGVNTKRFYAIGVYNSMGNTLEAFRNFLSNNNMILVYPLATPTESAIPGRVISPIEGVNNYWNDAGGDTEIQYFENEA